MRSGSVVVGESCLGGSARTEEAERERERDLQFDIGFVHGGVVKSVCCHQVAHLYKCTSISRQRDGKAITDFFQHAREQNTSVSLP
jgi:hypothetical protein